MNSEQQTETLQQLADGLQRRRLVAPARIVMDMLTPLGFLAGQVALFIRPLVPQGRWHAYVSALSDEQGWELLHTLIERRDC
ncbi:MAG TPA: hypothetical protein PKK78_07925 [Kouleothrix sp.]|nr:hypothetical protein [Kouleothrix sp.]